MDGYIYSQRVAGWIVGPRCSATFIPHCPRVIIQSFVLLLWPVVAMNLMPESGFAEPYDCKSSGYGRAAIAELAAQQPPDHSPVLAAGFGFQAVGASLITVRTYDVQTGAVLSEDSFDVNVKEEGAAVGDGNRGRIFAGGFGTDAQGNSKFLLRVYDAETGRFLWEGQLNLFKGSEAGVSTANATVVPQSPFALPVADHAPQTFQSLFSVRAVDPITGRLVWQDLFTPGVRKQPRNARVSCRRCSIKPVNEPIEHIFDLIVRTYDRTSGLLLWEDSFEEIDRTKELDSEPEMNVYPQAIPSWTGVADETTVSKAALH